MPDLLQPPGRVIAYFPSLSRMAGSVKAAILLEQVKYWTPRAHDAEGWIYKGQVAWMDETGLTLKEFRGACDELETRKLIVREYDRMNHQLRIQLQVDNYNAAVQGLPEDRQVSAQDKRAHTKRAHTKKAYAKRAHAKRASGTCQKGTCPNNVVTEITQTLPPTPLMGEGDTIDDPPPKTTLRERFSTFWAAYPRKTAKGAAWKRWEQLRPTDDLLNRMLAAIASQRASPDWKREGGRFIPHPATWLNQQRWEDEGLDLQGDDTLELQL